MAKIKDLTLLSDIFPTGYHGAVTAGVGPGIDRLRRRRRPGRPGLRGRLPSARRGGRDRRRHDSRAAGAGQELRLRDDRPAQEGHARASRSRRSSACPKWIAPSIAWASKRAATARDAGVERPATVLNSLMTVTRAGGAIGIPGLYVTDDPGGVDAQRQDRQPRHPHRPGLGQVALPSPPASAR